MPGRDPASGVPSAPAPAEHPAAALQGADVPRPRPGILSTGEGQNPRERVNPCRTGSLPVGEGQSLREKVDPLGRGSVLTGGGQRPCERVLFPPLEPISLLSHTSIPLSAELLAGLKGTGSVGFPSTGV